MVEIELKMQLLAAAEQDRLVAILQEMSAAQGRERFMMAADYFDTPAGELREQRLAYRLRRENDKTVATIKGGSSAAGGLHERQEWNIPLSAGAMLTREMLREHGVADGVAELLCRENLQPIVRTEFVRQVFDLCFCGTQIEAAWDRGTVSGGGRQESIAEVELELKYGQPEALLRLGAELAARVALLPLSRSKYLRGMELYAGHSMPESIRSGDSALSRWEAFTDSLCLALLGQSVDTAGLRGCLWQLEPELRGAAADFALLEKAVLQLASGGAVDYTELTPALLRVWADNIEERCVG